MGSATRPPITAHHFHEEDVEPCPSIRASSMKDPPSIYPSSVNAV
jgi:hypothetical protein